MKKSESPAAVIRKISSGTARNLFGACLKTRSSCDQRAGAACGGRKIFRTSIVPVAWAMGELVCTSSIIQKYDREPLTTGQVDE